MLVHSSATQIVVLTNTQLSSFLKIIYSLLTFHCLGQCFLLPEVRAPWQCSSRQWTGGTFWSPSVGLILSTIWERKQARRIVALHWGGVYVGSNRTLFALSDEGCRSSAWRSLSLLRTRGHQRGKEDRRRGRATLIFGCDCQTEGGQVAVKTRNGLP